MVVIFLISLILGVLTPTLIHANSEDPLLLSPLIKEGRIAEALQLAEVKGLVEGLDNPRSYSGFITVDEQFNTNLFFWFFPASKDLINAPIIFWSDGGPGATLLNSFFNMHGPYRFDQDKNLVNRDVEFTWHSEYNIIYLDNPAGVGFSFTEDEAGYAKSGIETAPNIYNFLLQFFKLFPSLRNNEFYNGGVSYGGTYAVAIAHYIHTKNNEMTADPESKINLRGLIMDSPWFHPELQVDHGTWLHNLGFISPEQKETFDQQRDEMGALLKEGKIKEASQICFQQSMTIVETTGILSLYDFTSAEWLDILAHNYTDLITSPHFREALHTGSKTEFFMVSRKVQTGMKDNFMQSVKPLLEELLKAEETYKLLVYSGNVDGSTWHLGVEKVLYSLDLGSPRVSDYNKRLIWKDEDPSSVHKSSGVSGYIQNIQNSTERWFAIVRNAGHGCSMEQPGKVFQLVRHFVKGEIEKLAKDTKGKGFKGFKSAK